MKIEKLTENKIRIIINSEDLDETNTDINSLMTKSIETQSLFLEMLLRAEKEVGFNTEGCKLLIEAFSSIDGILVFTITKSEKLDCNSINNQRKKLTVKRKNINSIENQIVCSFNNFEQFCDFCNYINNISEFDIKKLSKNISLYLYNDTYYLIIENINRNYIHLRKFYFAISEFGNLISYSLNFKNKLAEHGKVIIKKNAIDTGIKFFIN
ncbi:MAG: adaptor protein MecA [Clostridia bacterium]|nr:adaptor protein MecA [Clostridia bacterium]